MGWSFLPIRDFNTLAEQWDRLNRNSYDTPLIDSFFVASLIKYFSTGRELIGCFENGGRYTAMIILTQKNPFSWITFQPHQAPLGLFVMEKGADYGNLYDQLIRALPGPAQILGIMFQDINHFPKIPNSSTIRSHIVYYTPTIDLAGNFEQFWTSRSKSFRKQFNNRYNKIKKHGISTCYNYLSSPEDVVRGVETYGLIESTGWKGRSHTAVHPDNIQGKLYTEIMRSFALKGESRIYQYLYDNIVVASDLCLLRDKTLYILKTTYDESYSDTSPTQLMRREYIEDLFQNGEVDRIESYGRIKNWHRNVAQQARPILVSNIYKYRIARALHRPRVSIGLSSINDQGYYEAACYGSFADVPQKIKKALAAVAGENFFHSPDWYDLLEKHILGKNQTLKIYVISDGLTRDPYMVYPLIVEEGKGLAGTRHIIRNFVSVYDLHFTPVLMEGNYDLKQLVAYFLKRITADNKWDIIDLNLFLDPAVSQDSFFACLEEAAAKIFASSYTYRHSVNWTTAIPDSSYENYIESRPSNLRNTLKRKLRKLSRSRQHEILSSRTPDDVDKAIQDYQIIYDASWKEPEKYPDFIPEFLRSLSRAGVLRLYILHIDQQPASFVAMIVLGKKAIIYKLAYDPDFKNYSPGTIVLNEAIKDVIQKDKVHFIDFGLGDDPYKKNWMTEKTNINGIIIHNRRSVYGLRGALVHCLGRLGSQLPFRKKVSPEKP